MIPALQKFINDPKRHRRAAEEHRLPGEEHLRQLIAAGAGSRRQHRATAAGR